MSNDVLSLANLAGSVSKGKTNSNYASITDQAGIHASNEGYTINTGKTTTLNGAIISSEADKAKNSLTTDNLVMKDIQNKASYSSSDKGIGLSLQDRSKLNPLGLSPIQGIPVTENASSTTRSAITDAIIKVANTKSLKEIKHDTANALQKLGTIFDKKSVEEKKEFINLLSKEGYTLIGDIAEKK